MQRCGVVIEHVLVLVQTVRYSNDMLGLLVARGIAARNEEQAEKQVCEMTNQLHKSGIDFDFVCKGSKNIVCGQVFL